MRYDALKYIMIPANVLPQMLGGTELMHANVGVFYTNDNGDLVFTQAVEYVGDNFYFTVCGDDVTTEEKDGFDIGESFIWQLWPTGEDCAYSIDVEYSSGELSSGEYEVNGISQVVSISGSSLEASVSVTDVKIEKLPL